MMLVFSSLLCSSFGSSTFFGLSGTVSDGHNNNSYVPGMSCSFHFLPSQSILSQAISFQVDFQMFQTEGGYDYVTIYGLTHNQTQNNSINGTQSVTVTPQYQSQQQHAH